MGLGAGVGAGAGVGVVVGGVTGFGLVLPFLSDAPQPANELDSISTAIPRRAPLTVDKKVICLRSLAAEGNARNASTPDVLVGGLKLWPNLP